MGKMGYTKEKGGIGQEDAKKRDEAKHSKKKERRKRQGRVS